MSSTLYHGASEGEGIGGLRSASYCAKGLLFFSLLLPSRKRKREKERERKKERTEAATTLVVYINQFLTTVARPQKAVALKHKGEARAGREGRRGGGGGGT